MKKILPVFLAIIIFFTSTLMQVNKAQAVGQLAVPLAAGTGAGYAAVGAYVIGGLLVAGGAAVILDDPDSANKIKTHSMNVWNTFDSATRDAWSAAIDSSIAAGKGTLTLTDKMFSDIEAGLVTIGQEVQTLVYSYEANKSGVNPSATWSLSIDYKKMEIYDSRLTILVAGGMSTYVQLNANQSYNYSTGVYDYSIDAGTDRTNYYKSSSGTPPQYWQQVRNATNQAAFKSMAATLGLGYPVVKLKQSIAPATTDYFSDSVNQAINGLKTGTKEVALSIDNFIAKNTAGEPLKYDSTSGNVLNPDGSVYTGNPVYDAPVFKTPAIPNVSAPSVPVSDVYVGDTPFVGSPDTTAPSTGDTGILQGLWDWLKGILQKILDAILALASLVGIIAIIEKISSLIESLSQSVTSWKDAPTKKIDWSRLAVAAGTLTTVFPFSIPWDVFRLFNVLNVQPITPKFEISTNKNINIAGANIPVKYDFDVDFSVFNPIAAIGRWALVLIFDIAIIMALRRLTPD